jgi:hypothetical protein
MCFSPLASISTFIIGIIGAILCLTLGTPTDKLVGYFFGFVSSMQGIEFLLWINQDCNNINKFISLLGMILNHLQPIILSILILLLNNNLSTTTKQIIILSTIIYAIVITAYSFQLKEENDKCTLKNEFKHLEWKWNDMKNKTIVYMLFLFMLILLFYVGTPDKKSGVILSAISLISYLISYFIYKDEKVIGALWCLFASFTPILWYGTKKFNLK